MFICYGNNYFSHSSKTERKINISSIQPRGMLHKHEFCSGTHNATIVDTVAKNMDIKLPKNM